MLQVLRDERGLPGSGGFELDLKVDISGNKEGRIPSKGNIMARGGSQHSKWLEVWPEGIGGE